MILNFQEIQKLLKKYNLPKAESVLVNSEDEAVYYAQKIGYPVVLKISSKHLHRTEIGGVITNIKDELKLKESFNKLKKIPEIEAVIVQKQIPGEEFIVGIKKDPTFGQVVMLGTGGTFVELFNDVSFRVCPIDKKESLLMIEEIKGKKLLEGFRGAPEIDKRFIAEILEKVSQLGIKENIEELDFNPLIVSEKGAFICDVKIII